MPLTYTQGSAPSYDSDFVTNNLGLEDASFFVSQGQRHGVGRPTERMQATQPPQPHDEWTVAAVTAAGGQARTICMCAASNNFDGCAARVAQPHAHPCAAHPNFED